jgi:hypothetical protein
VPPASGDEWRPISTAAFHAEVRALAKGMIAAGLAAHLGGAGALPGDALLSLPAAPLTAASPFHSPACPAGVMMAAGGHLLAGLLPPPLWRAARTPCRRRAALTMRRTSRSCATRE